MVRAASQRRRPPAADRGADRRRRGRRPAGGHRLLPAGPAGPRGQRRHRRGGGSWCRPGPWPSCSGCSSPGRARRVGDGRRVGPTSACRRRPRRHLLAGDVKVSTRLLDGTYPDYRQLIPDELPEPAPPGKETRCSPPCAGCGCWSGTTPRRCGCRCARRGRPQGGRPRRSATPARRSTATSTGEDLVIAFNPSYLIDGVEAVAGDEVMSRPSDATKPATVRGGRGDRLPLPADAGPGLLSDRGRRERSGTSSWPSPTSGSSPSTVIEPDPRGPR